MIKDNILILFFLLSLKVNIFAQDIVYHNNDDVGIKKMNWQEAKKYCYELCSNASCSWKLPSIQELRYLKNNKKSLKTIVEGYYWSDTKYEFDNQDVWAMFLSLNAVYRDHYNMNNNHYVICSRIYQKKYKSFNSYTKYPFKEISKLVNENLNLWLEPRKIKKPILPPEIKKPKLPAVPKLIKSQFETKKMFEERVNKEISKRDKIIKQLQEEYRKKVEARNKKIKQLQKQYNDEIALIKKEQEYKKAHIQEKIKQLQKGALKVVMGTFHFTNPKYDAENQTMYVTIKSSRSSYQKRVALSVPLNIAKNFYDNIKNIKADVKFDFDKNKITLNSINAIYDNKTYMAKLTDKDFKPEKVEVVLKDKKVNFKADKPIKLTLQNPNLKDYYQVGGVIYQEGKKVSGKKYNDDIPTLLAHTKQTPISNKKWLFVVGIGKYDNTDNIAYASRTAKLFTKVAQKTLGISKRHTYFLLDDKATTARILNNLKIMLREVKRGDTIYFYYNGHGIPAVTKNNEPFILPSDQIPDFVVENDNLMLKNIYKKLSASKASKIVAFVDSCFSGATDGKAVIKGVAATRLVPKNVTFNHKKMVVLTAGRNKEYSNAYPQKGERLFSYYVMKSLLKGRKDIKSLYSEVYIKVKDTSNSFGPLKVQEPTISGNKDIKL